MITVNNRHNGQLRRRLESLTARNRDYWSFRGNARREHGHGLFQYPAMMVPQAAKTVIEQACKVHPDIEWIGDPFSGSGTIMTEAMMCHRHFFGTDINPLAVLLCKVKKGPFFLSSLTEKIEDILARIREDTRAGIEADFPGIDKWFTEEVQASLSIIRRAIRRESSLWARRFLWVALAETVRMSSNSRTTTFKLHIRSENDLNTRQVNPASIFARTVRRNFEQLREQEEKLADAGQLSRGCYTGKIQVRLQDIRTCRSRTALDLIVTSPPYGDNATTVPYGQYSYLPLQWIDLEDIDSNVDPDCLDTTHGIDSRSLGGSKRLQGEVIDQLRERSPLFGQFVDTLRNEPKDRTTRVASFFGDLNDSLLPILRKLHPGGLMIWTLGNRSVGGRRVPLDGILEELLNAHNSSTICRLQREIASKRMPSRNNVSDTMLNETILVMRKATNNA